MQRLADQPFAVVGRRAERRGADVVSGPDLDQSEDAIGLSSPKLTLLVCPPNEGHCQSGLNVPPLNMSSYTSHHSNAAIEGPRTRNCAMSMHHRHLNACSNQKRRGIYSNRTGSVISSRRKRVSVQLHVELVMIHACRASIRLYRKAELDFGGLFFFTLASRWLLSHATPEGMHRAPLPFRARLDQTMKEHGPLAVHMGA